MVPDLLNLPSMYLIGLAREQSSSLICILRIYMAAEPLLASSRASMRLVQYSMIRDSDLFFGTLLPRYDYWSPVVISVSLTLGVTCGN